jgi:hypothetical protein
VAHLDPWLALGVSVSTAVTDAVYVMFNAAVSKGRIDRVKRTGVIMARAQILVLRPFDRRALETRHKSD